VGCLQSPLLQLVAFIAEAALSLLREESRELWPVVVHHLVAGFDLAPEVCHLVDC
jgi:hypothetical protein